MADFGNAAWAWIKDVSDPSSKVGSNCADSSGWVGQHAISTELEADFTAWALSFENESVNDFVAIDWGIFHGQGHVLCHRLKQELGNAAQVCYVKPAEDPAEDFTSGVEFYLDGGVHGYARDKLKI